MNQRVTCDWLVELSADDVRSVRRGLLLVSSLSPASNELAALPARSAAAVGL